MGSFSFNEGHIIERLMERYDKSNDEAHEIFNRVRKTLEEHTPKDWRFTDSPSSRFFILEEQTGAKFFGMSYRSSPDGDRLLSNIRAQLDDPTALAEALDDYIEDYIKQIQRDDLTVIHDIRTVYGAGPQAHIAEERILVERSRAAVSHTLPLYAKKIAARPNAAVFRDGSLWVRQYLNWMSQDPSASEYYVFQRLTRDGVDKTVFRVYAHAHNGAFKPVDECRVCHSSDCRPAFPNWKRGAAIRSESYWKLPTLLDMRLADLDYCERYAAKGVSFSARDLLELYWLRRITEGAREKLYRKL